MVPQVTSHDRPPGYLLTCSARFLILIVLSTLISACTDRGEDPELVRETVPTIRFPWPNVAIQQVFADPHAFVGKAVVVHGEVTEIIDQNSITIQDDGETMLVVGADLPIERLETGDCVRVDGAIRDFDIREIERELGFELWSEQLARFNDQPVSVASDVTIGPTSEDDLVANAGVFAGRTVTVTGELAIDAEGDGFVLRPIDGDDALLVTMSKTALKDLPIGTWVQVTGVVELDGPRSPAQDSGENPYQVTLNAETVEIVGPSVT